jgi:hypothetical protein
MIRKSLCEEFTKLLHDHVPGLKVTDDQATGHVPWREDKHPSLSADLSKGVWYDHATREGGGVKAFKERLGLNGSQPRREIVAVYSYTDEQGNLLFEVVRLTTKEFPVRRPDPTGKWIWNGDGVRRVLYNLPEVLKAETVYIVEGEKDADRLCSLGFTLPVTRTALASGARSTTSTSAANRS